MIIRKENPQDATLLSELHYAAFKDHPQHAPGAEPHEPGIVEGLRASGGLSLSLVGEEQGEIIAHVAVSPATIGEGSHGWYGLGPIATKPSRQGMGVGSALMRETLKQMQARGASGIVLAGDPHFYERFGFRRVAGLTYRTVPGQYILALAFTQESPVGEIVFHPAFG